MEHLLLSRYQGQLITLRVSPNLRHESKVSQGIVYEMSLVFTLLMKLKEFEINDYFLYNSLDLTRPRKAQRKLINRCKP